MTTNGRSKYWCFTINNYSELDLSSLGEAWTAQLFTYVVFGKEIGGETGTRHLQGYVELPNRLRFNQVKALLPDGTHIEARRGTAQEASDYCKKDGDFVEHGLLSRTNQGRRRDLDIVADLARTGTSLREIATAAPTAYIKYYKGIAVLRTILNPRFETTAHTERRFNKVHDWTKTQVFLGPTNCGKTTYALQLLPRALFVTHLDKLGEYDPENYDGIIFDEACFVHLPRESQIHLCDQDQGRQLHVRYLCANIPAHTKKIFTSNRELHEILLIDPAIERRIEVHQFSLESNDQVESEPGWFPRRNLFHQ